MGRRERGIRISKAEMVRKEKERKEVAGKSIINKHKLLTKNLNI